MAHSLQLAKMETVKGPKSYKLVGYYENWAQYRPEDKRLLPNDIDATLLTHINFAFGKIDQNYELAPTEDNDFRE